MILEPIAFGERQGAAAEGATLIGEGKLGALAVQHAGDAPGDRAIVGDAHDQSALFPAISGAGSAISLVVAMSVTLLPVKLLSSRSLSHPSRWNTSVALVPPKPKLFDITQLMATLSMRSRTIGMSANSGSSFRYWRFRR